MSYLQALLLGILQGFTEFLPVSSSGHLVLFQEILGLGNAVALKAFDIAVHFGTLLAILIYFRQDFIDLFKALYCWTARVPMKTDESEKWLKESKTMIVILLAGTVPAVLAGLLWGDWIDRTFLSPVPVCVMLLLVSLVFLGAEYVYKKARHGKNIGLLNGVLIGCAQAVALIPGVSRSGATISAGLALGIEREKAARFSFILGAIAMVAATALAVLKVLKGEYSLPPLDILVLGIASSWAAGWLAISFLINYLKKHTLAIFAYYRIILVVFFLAWFYLR